MAKSIKFEWDYVGNLGKKFLNNYETLNKSLNNINDINQSLSTCWEGVDANTFKNSLNNYVETVKTDAGYFQFLSDYFDVASKTIGGTVETHGEKFSRMDNEISDKADYSRRKAR